MEDWEISGNFLLLFYGGTHKYDMPPQLLNLDPLQRTGTLLVKVLKIGNGV
jgi:hypothetical protein